MKRPIQCHVDLIEHEGDERIRIPRSMTGRDSIIISILKFMDAAFKRQILENRIPFREQSRLPETSHASIAILEGMDKHKFIVEHAGQDQWMHVAACNLHPIE